MGDSSGRRCPCCSGTRFCHGVIPDSGGSWLLGTNRLRFKPDANWMTTHSLQAFACLDCGFVGLRLDDEGIAALRQAAEGQ